MNQFVDAADQIGDQQADHQTGNRGHQFVDGDMLQIAFNAVRHFAAVAMKDRGQLEK